MMLIKFNVGQHRFRLQFNHLSPSPSLACVELFPLYQASYWWGRWKRGELLAVSLSPSYPRWQESSSLPATVPVAAAAPLTGSRNIGHHYPHCQRPVAVANNCPLLSRFYWSIMSAHPWLGERGERDAGVDQILTRMSHHIEFNFIRETEKVIIWRERDKWERTGLVFREFVGRMREQTESHKWQVKNPPGQPI